MARTKHPKGKAPAASKGKVGKGQGKGYAAGGRIATVVPADLPAGMAKGGRAKKKGC